MANLIDKDAYRRHTAKEFHPHLAHFDAELERLIRRSPAHRSMVENPFAMFSITHAFPVVHLVAMCRNGGWIYYPAPQTMYAIRDGHRTVSSSGGETRGAQPIIRFEIVTDQVLVPSKEKLELFKSAGASAPEFRTPFEAVAKPAQLFSAPLAILKKGTAGRFRQPFSLYQHVFGGGHEYPDDGLFYIGITARDWQKRWAEHRAAINRDSPLKFHRMYRERMVSQKLSFVHHRLMGVASTLDEIQALEETFVAGHWQDERLLNMIPGGKAGIAYLHKHRIIGKGAVLQADQVEQALERWMKEHPHRGLPAPWMAEHWQDNDYALKVICGPEGRLSIDQVLQIRFLGAGGVPAADIVEQVGAKNISQVQRVLDGKTYTRVPDVEGGSDLTTED
ncbi:hypothetical protein [Stutzerimonas stutzeri]|uniref:hypothetical protein n=1 Tax=Stutzerimonas stutzeri TaxID=316 RepID=UPI001BCEC561|nr:hypothetical protein [Stutzerimonas stutzeri]